MIEGFLSHGTKLHGDFISVGWVRPLESVPQRDGKGLQWNENINNTSMHARMGRESRINYYYSSHESWDLCGFKSGKASIFFILEKKKSLNLVTILLDCFSFSWAKTLIVSLLKGTFDLDDSRTYIWDRRGSKRFYVLSFSFPPFRFLLFLLSFGCFTKFWVFDG